MTDVKDAPRRTAMQVALDAEKAAGELRGELENISALAEAAAESGGSAPVGGALRELVKDVSKVVGLIPGNLWTGQGGALATQEQVAEVRGNLAHIAELLAAMPDYAGSDSKLKPQALFDSVLAVDGRLREVEKWRAAELDEDAGGSGDALAERIAKLEQQLWRPHHAEGAQNAPHVLGLIGQLQRRVFEIGKGREFRAENTQGRVTQSYDFRGVEDAQNAVGSAQREIGLIGPAVTVLDKQVSVTEVNKGSYTQVWTTVSVTCRYTFQSTVDGSEWSTEGCGMGRDLGDKAESKALAGAYKYALFHGLNIPVKGVFVDAETEDPRIERDQPDAGRTYGHGQANAPIDGGDAFDPGDHDGRQDERDAARRVDSGREPDPRTPEQQAAAALAAARRAPDLATVNTIVGRAQELGIMDIPIDGGDNAVMPLRVHLNAIARLVPRGPAVPRG